MEYSRIRLMEPAGGVFDHRQEPAERLHYGPGEEARHVVAPTANGPAPSRWSCVAFRPPFASLHSYSLSEVWRLVQGWGVSLRPSPDPAYAAKPDRLLHCLREAAKIPEEVVVLFLDEMGYFRWPDAAPDWAEVAPAKAPDRSQSSTAAAHWHPECTNWAGGLSGELHCGTRANSCLLRTLEPDLCTSAAHVRNSGYLVHSLASRCRGRAGGVSSIGSCLVADLCTLAEPDSRNSGAGCARMSSRCLGWLALELPCTNEYGHFWINLPLGRMTCSAL